MVLTVHYSLPFDGCSPVFLPWEAFRGATGTKVFVYVDVIYTAP